MASSSEPEGSRDQQPPARPAAWIAEMLPLGRTRQRKRGTLRRPGCGGSGDVVRAESRTARGGAGDLIGTASDSPGLQRRRDVLRMRGRVRLRAAALGCERGSWRERRRRRHVPYGAAPLAQLAAVRLLQPGAQCRQHPLPSSTETAYAPITRTSTRTIRSRPSRSAPLGVRVATEDQVEGQQPQAEGDNPKGGHVRGQMNLTWLSPDRAKPHTRVSGA